ncbi:MAG: hypothetical protein JWN39_2663 [Ilumatobacteraceae bacterium]|nr:hypothetical protein [Ilumatobacteraceae bacterium]
MAELEGVQDRDPAGVSRRLLLAGGLGAVAGGSATVAAMQSGDASAAGVPKLDIPHPETLATMVSQCTYLPLDATAFFTQNPSSRVIDDVVGVNANNGGLWVEASLPIMAGAVIRQIQISYRGSPTFSLVSRAMEGPTPIGQSLITNLDAGPGNKTQTIDLDGSPGRSTVFVNTRTTYSLRFVIPNPKTDSIFGVSIGHVPPTQLFVPNLSSPRVYDTRLAGSGGPTKLAPGEERIVDMAYPGRARPCSTSPWPRRKARAASLRRSQPIKSGPGTPASTGRASVRSLRTWSSVRWMRSAGSRSAAARTAPT